MQIVVRFVVKVGRREDGLSKVAAVPPLSIPVTVSRYPTHHLSTISSPSRPLFFPLGSLPPLRLMPNQGCGVGGALNIDSHAFLDSSISENNDSYLLLEKVNECLQGIRLPAAHLVCL